MASGDVISVEHNAGSGSTFSYTSTVDFIVLNQAGVNWGVINLNNWVSATSGIYGILSDQFCPGGSRNGDNKFLIPSGSVLGKTDPDMNTYGCALIGIEL